LVILFTFTWIVADGPIGQQIYCSPTANMDSVVVVLTLDVAILPFVGWLVGYAAGSYWVGWF
jgi:hypothetical protein